jgi:hypothetical protein
MCRLQSPLCWVIAYAAGKLIARLIGSIVITTRSVAWRELVFDYGVHWYWFVPVPYANYDGIISS